MVTFLICGGNQPKRSERISSLLQELKPQSFPNDPDVLTLSADAEIGIEEIRHLKYWYSLKAFHQPPKIAIISQAEALSDEALAVLGQLLDLENENNFLILAAPNNESLGAKISSRCQVITLSSVAPTELSDEEMIKEKELAEKICQLNLGERLKFSENYKTKDEALSFSQNQLTYWHDVLLVKPDKQLLELCRAFAKTINYLQKNTNPRLTIDHLLIQYPFLRQAV